MQNTRPNSWANSLRHTALVAFAATVISSGGASGCNASACDTSPDANPPQRFTGGVTVDGVYQSTPSWQNGFLDYPGGKRYEFVHNLGAAPPNIDVFLAFDTNASGGATKCAGNTCIVTADDQLIRVRNDTCAEFWIRVVADVRGHADVVGDSGTSPDGD